MSKTTSVLSAMLVCLALFLGACAGSTVSKSDESKDAPKKEAASEGSGETSSENSEKNEKESVSKDTSKIITTKAAGKVKIGATIAKVREAVKPLTLKRESDGEGIALIAVMKGNKILMMIYAGEEDPDAKIDEKAKVDQIEVLDSSFKTEKGVSPGMKIGDAEAKYGKVKEIMLSEIEAREFAEFSKQPKALNFRLESSNGQAGVYEKGKQKTTKYTPKTKIASITVWRASDSEGNADSEFSSSYTSLSNGCKSTGGEEGGHVSTICKGPGGYQINYFDTASTLQFSVEKSDGKDSISLVSQSLSYDTKKGKVEFRSANGTPFAVIMRTYGKGKAEHLIVKGLKGYESIDAKIDVRKTKNANQAARKAADDGYSK